MLFVIVTPFISTGQNIHDPYKDIFGFTTSTYQATGTQYPSGGYQGEYQFYLPYDHPWSKIPNAEFSVKTECVSFPFLPIYKYHDQTSNGQPNRVLGVPESNTMERNSNEEYFIIQGYYNPTLTNQTFTDQDFTNSEAKLHTKFPGEAWYSIGSTGQIYNGFLSTVSSSITDNNTIISDLFQYTNSGVGTFDNSSRNLFPHSILKHTLYVRSICNTNEIIDSIIYIVDLTRGRMVNYPFQNTALNPTISPGPTHYDIIVKLEAEAPSTYGSTGGSFTSEHSGNSYPIYNYFNSENTNWLFGSDGVCNPNIYIPDTYPSSGDYLAFGNTLIKLPQYSKTGVLLLNHYLSNRAGYDDASSTLGNINPLFKHTYKIDREFDISYINPSEKIVYNPSEVEIDLNNTNNTGSRTLTFPSGYTFKTVLGNYPNKQHVINTDPNNYYGKDPFKIPVTNTADTGPNAHGYQSKYIVKSGSKLVIEDCVTILDAEIVVEDGAEIHINRTKVFGNYTIVINTGGTEYPYTGPNQSNSCIQECLNTTIIAADWHNKTINADLTLSANTTKRVFGTLTIAAGTKLFLEEGCTLEFAPNSRLIIETNGDLYATGTASNQVKLTSMCNNMWDGIELRAASVHLNYAILENAYTGVRDFSTKDPNVVSGHFESNHAIIRNCITGLHLKSPLGTLSTYTLLNCTFETTNDLPDSRFSVNNPNKPTIVHVRDERSHGYSYWNCTFQNLNTWLKPHERGIGIKSNGSSFSVGLTYATINNTFLKLAVGIYASQNKSHQLTVINNATFFGNIYGVILLNSSYVDISDCQFEVPANTTLPANTPVNETDISFYNRPTGIYAKNSSGFYIYDNTFKDYLTKTTGNPICSNCNQAIVLDGTSLGGGDPRNGLVMNNTFENINIGVLAQNGNGTNSGSVVNLYVTGNGVSVVCNDFINLESYDMALTLFSDNMGGSYIPIRDQGYCANGANPDYDHPALNTFNTCSGQTRNVHNYYQNQDFKYYHAINNTPGCYATVTMKPCDNFNTDDDDVSAKCNDYYSNFDPSSLPLSGKRQQYIDKVKELEERTSSFDNLLDGGNTANLLDVVQNGTLATAIAQLEAAGAYISDAVLEAAITRLGVEETQKLILILQTNSKLSPTVWDAVVTHTTTYNSGLVEALTTYQEGISARESYIKWIDYTAYERNTIFDGLYFADMLVDSTLTVTLDVLRNNDDPYIQKKLLPLLISEGEYTEAETLLNTIKETDNSSLFILEQEAKLIMNRDAIGFYKLPESLKDALAQYWIDAPQQSSWSAMQAGVHTWEYYINPELINASTENNKWDGVQEDKQKENLNTSSYLTCYPNPTTSGGVIKGFVPMVKNRNTQIRIYNSIGQLIATNHIATEQFEIAIQLPAKGLYFIALYQNNKILKHQKWVVQ